MQEQYAIFDEGLQASEQVSQQLAEQLELFVRPLLIWLDRLVDKRLVRTFVSTLQVIVQFRQVSMGLLLSELGETTR
jgi:hypothetical protein